MMIYAIVASTVAVVLWMIWTFFITKRSESCRRIFTCERGYNPETPSNFWNNLKVTPVDDTPTKGRIGGVCHLVKLLWLHPHDRHQEAVVLTGPVLR